MSEGTKTLDYALMYHSLGFSIFPLKPRSKQPAVKTWKPYQEQPPTEEEVRKWFKDGKRNIAIVTGRVSNNLVVIDFDNEEVFKEFIKKLHKHRKLDGALNYTWVVKTGKGYHIYVKLQSPDLVPRTKPRLKPGLDIKAEGGYVVAPPSIHPSGKRYEFIKVGNDVYGPPDIREPITLSEREWNELLSLLEVKSDVKKEKIRKTVRRLNDDQIRRIVELIKPYYVKTHRNNIVYPLIGLLVKAGIDYESTRRVVELLVVETNDEESEQRFYLVDYHYGKRADEIGIERLKGISGVREELENVLREKGLPEDEIIKHVSETIAELYSILGLRRGPGVAWLERKGRFIKKWVAVGRQGIYLFRRYISKNGEVDYEPTIRIISNAIIRNVKTIKVLGLELRNLYMVDIDGEKISGTIDEILNHIEKHYGLERGSRYPIARFIEYTSEEEIELFYSPGPWVINNRIVFAREPGYTPPWKRYIAWKPPEDDIPEDQKRMALITIKNLVLAYKDPSKPSMVLSYSSIAPIMHYIKKTLSIAPHLLIHGLEDTGKSILLETIKLLYNITWDDDFPGTDFQARKCLALSTLPAIIDEIGSLIQGYEHGKRDSIEAIEILHRAATQTLLKASGGHTYGGYFLAIRTIIAATNNDISLIPWQLDKFILVTISVKEGIDINKARGYTPRTMPVEVKTALPYIGIELLKEVEKMLPMIEELKRYPREEIRKKLIKIGYEAWCNLYRRYGLGPFPPPNDPETDIEKASIKEQYKDIFISFIKLAVKEKIKDIAITVYEKEKAEKDPAALEDLRKNLAIIVRIINENNKSIIKEELWCKTAFLSKFKEWARKEFGIAGMGWKRLAEILGMTRTTRKIGGIDDKNILVMELEPSFLTY